MSDRMLTVGSSDFWELLDGLEKAPHPSKRMASTAEIAMLKDLMAKKTNYRQITRDWEEMHGKVPELIGPAPYYQTVTRICKEIKESS